MTAQDYIQSKLDDLKQPLGLPKPANDADMAEAIFKLVMSKKFRKYSCNDQLVQDIRQAIELSVKAHKPINFTFLHGAYKLWSLDEAPEADWAELFSAMYYTAWLKPICEIYQPGVWFDYFVDDLILPKLHTCSLEDMKQYRKSFQAVLDFLKANQPTNFKMTITGVGDQFESPAAFDKKLASDVERLSANLDGALPELTDERATMIDLNVKETPELTKDPEWRQKNTLIHDAYIGLTKRETNYHWQPDKIKVFTQPLASGTVIAVGSTKDSVAKFWVGVGALKPRDDSFRQVILTPKQLQDARFDFESVKLDGFEGKNFKRVRVLTQSQR